MTLIHVPDQKLPVMTVNQPVWIKNSARSFDAIAHIALPLKRWLCYRVRLGMQSRPDAELTRPRTDHL